MGARKPIVDECLLASMYEAGESVYYMSQELGVSRSYIYKVMSKLGLRPRGAEETYPLMSAKLKRVHAAKKKVRNET